MAWIRNISNNMMAKNKASDYDINTADSQRIDDFDDGNEAFSSPKGTTVPDQRAKRKGNFTPTSAKRNKTNLNDLGEKLSILDPEKVLCIHSYLNDYDSDKLVKEYVDLLCEIEILPIIPSQESIERTSSSSAHLVAVGCPIGNRNRFPNGVDDRLLWRPWNIDPPEEAQEPWRPWERVNIPEEGQGESYNGIVQNLIEIPKHQYGSIREIVLGNQTTPSRPGECVVVDNQIPGPSRLINSNNQSSITSRDVYRRKTCPLCNITFPKPADLDSHFYQQHREQFLQDDHQPMGQVGGGDEEEIVLRRNFEGHGGVLARYVYDQGEREFDNAGQYFDMLYRPSRRVFLDELRSRKNFKMWVSVMCDFEKPIPGEEEPEGISRGLTSFSHSILNVRMIPRIWKSIKENFDEQIETWTCEKSGWKLKNIRDFNLLIVTYRPLFGSNYIKFPKELQEKRDTFINVDNREAMNEGEQDMCFLWAVLASPSVSGGVINQNQDPKQVSTYNRPEIRDLVDDSGIRYPFSFSQIKRFERQNPEIGVLIAGYDMDKEVNVPLERMENPSPREIRYARARQRFQVMKERTVLLYNTKEDRSKKVDLLLLMKDDKMHYVTIKSLSRFLRPPTSEVHREICRNCFGGFQTMSTYQKHVQYCPALGLQKTSFSKYPKLSFDKYQREVPVPFVVYADFEAVLKKINFSPSTAGTTKLQNHVCDGYSWVCIDYDQDRRYGKHYRARDPNEDVAARFVRDMIEVNEMIQHELDEYQQDSLEFLTNLEVDGHEIGDQQDCCICHKALGTPDAENKIVRHHIHLPINGQFELKGFAHNSCNLKAQMSRFLPIFLHNGSKYDFHYIVKAIGNLQRSGDIETVEVIPRSSENFMSIIVNTELRFVDSLNFTAASLDKLVETMKLDSDVKFKIVEQEFEREIANGLDVNMLMSKSAYPYSYMQSLETFEETQFPPIEAFFNDLKGTPLNQEKYDEAKLLYQTLGMRNLGDWHDLYVRLDAALLADVMQNIRKIVSNAYNGMDLCHYFSLPGLAWDGVLKMSEETLSLITDSTIHCFVETAIRGGYVSTGSLKVAKANNKYMLGEHDPSKTSQYILYIDANNLYGTAMTQPLPLSEFEFLGEFTEDEIDLMREFPDLTEKMNNDIELLAKIKDNPEQFIKELDDDGDYGFMIQADLFIPPELHDKFNDMPPCPTRRETLDGELSSSYQEPMIEDLKIDPSLFRTSKLICDLNPKLGYIAHHSTLKVYEQIGVKIENVQRVLRFKQTSWMKAFIDFNTLQRQRARTEFEKAFWKLLNNSAFGKTIEQKRHRQNVVIITDGNRLIKYVNKPTVQKLIPIDPDCTIALMKRLSVVLDKPTAVGASVLERSKAIMYNFHYNVIQEIYGTRAKLIYTDTDSLIYLVETEDVFEDMKRNCQHFDMSEYDPNHPLFGRFHDETNKKVLGKFKDEFSNSIITHIAAPKPKMYGIRSIACKRVNKSYEMDQHNNPIMNPIECKKAKGLTKTSVDNQIPLSDYVKVLEENVQTRVLMTGIKSKEHEFFTEDTVKRALNGMDTKRYCIDSVSTLAFGHRDIPLYEM